MSKQSRRNRENGFSLATVIGLGVIASLWLLGTAGLVVSTAGKLTRERSQDMMRASAEASLDWAVQTLNQTPQASPIDGQVDYSVPSSIMSDSNKVASVISVRNYSAPDYSYLYDATCDSSKSNNNIFDGNGWRVITATSFPAKQTPTEARNLGTVKQVSVVLKPIYTTTSHVVGVPGPPQPYFVAAIASPNGIGGVGHFSTKSYNSASTPKPTTAQLQNTNGDLWTNGVVDLGSGVSIGGNIVGYSNADPAVSLNHSTVYGNVQTLGTIANNGSSIAGTQGVPSGSPLSFPPAPPAPSGSTATTIDLSGNQTKTLTAGNYVVSSISISGNGQLIIDSSAGPVNIYVQGASSNGVTIGGNGINNGNVPNGLRIWYGGTSNVQINGNGSFTGVIYAPNANVKLNGNGNIYGAVVGGYVTTNGNARLAYDTQLGTGSSATWIPIVNQSINGKQVQYWQAVSWMEL